MPSNFVRRGAAMRVLAAISAALVALFALSSAYADTCNPVPGDESDASCGGFIYPAECPAFAGGVQQITSSGGATAWPQSAVANISSYNPYPVYTASSMWSALEQNSSSPGLIAQIGWTHDRSWFNEYVFAQITDSNGNYSPTHNFYTTPSGVENYSVYRESDSTFDLEWSGGFWLPGSGYKWGSDTVAFVGEVDAYDPGEKDGDHFPGNNTSPVTVSNATWADQYGNGHTANLCYFAGNKSCSISLSQTASYSRLYNWSSSQFEVWDSRCS